eukprot:UN01330
MRTRFGAFASVQRDKCASYILASLCAKYLPTCYYDKDDNAQRRYPTKDFCPDTKNIKSESDQVEYTMNNVVPEDCLDDSGNTDKKNSFFFFRDKTHQETVRHMEYSLRPQCYNVDEANQQSLENLDQICGSEYTAAKLVYADPEGSTNMIIPTGTALLEQRAKKAIADPECFGIYKKAHWPQLKSAQIQADPRYTTFIKTLSKMNVKAYSPAITTGKTIDLPTHPCPALLTAVNPMEYKPDQSPCAIPCPNLTFTEKQYKKEDVVIIVFNALSIAALFVLLLSWIIFPALRLQSYVFYYIICISVMTLALFILIPIASAQNKTIAESLCSSETTEYHMEGYAVVQAIVVCFCYLSATAWGLIMVLDIFIQVVVGKHFQKQSREHVIKERLYHIFAWFCGTYSVVGGLASQQMGSLVSVGGAYALITPSRDQQNEGVFNGGDVFFYYPLLVLTIISVLLMFAVLYRLIRFRMQAKTTGLKLATFVRLCLFIVANTFIICVLLIYTIYITGKRDELNRLTNQFVQCLHLAQTFGTNIAECGEAPKHGLNFDILLLSVALFNGMGFIAFLIYGTTFDLLYSWLGLLYVLTGWSILKPFEKDYKRNRKSTKATTKTHSTTANQSKLSRSGTSGFISTGLHGPGGSVTDHHGGGSRYQNDSGSGPRQGGGESSSHAKSVFGYQNQHRKGTITNRNPISSMNHGSQGGSIEMTQHMGGYH